MITPLLRKLENLVLLTDEEKRALLDAEATVRHLEARTDIIVEGEPREGLHLVVDGFACRYKLLPDGRRQIVSYLLPGDLCDAHILLMDHVDHSVATLSRVTVAVWPRQTIVQMAEAHPGIARAFWWSTFMEESISREWLVNLGQRTALERLSHLVCEIYYRLDAVGRTRGASFELPITQAELADTLGLSVVHVNRTLQEMRRDRLVTLTGKVLTILDLDLLRTIAMFSPNYLRPGPQRSGIAETRERPGGSADERHHLRSQAV
jgi:CRP-like cAMP-binding protein